MNGLAVPNRLAVVGDSLMARNLSTGTNLAGHDTRGAVTWANVYMGHKLDLCPISAVPGDRSDQILSRLRTQLLQYKPGVVLVEAGVNDLFAQRQPDEIIGYLRAIYTLALDAGAVVVATTITPSTSYNTANLTVRSKVNKWIREYQATTPGIVLCDWSMMVEDPHANTFWLPLYSTDHTHPSSRGASAMGYRLAQILAPLFPTPSPFLPVSNWDTQNPVTNSMMDSTGTPYTFSGTGTNSFVTRADGIPGNWLQMTTASAVQYSAFPSTTIKVNGFFQPGDYVYATCEMQSDAWTTWSDARLSLIVRDSASSQLYLTSDLYNSQADPMPPVGLPYQPGLASTAVLRTPAVQLPSNAFFLVPLLTFTGQGTVRFSRVGIYKADGTALIAS